MTESKKVRWIALAICLSALSVSCLRVGFRSAGAAVDGKPIPGEVKLFAGKNLPTGWAPCDGRLLNIAEHPRLFDALGTTYGGDGTTTFALPDLRGRVALHAGQGGGLTLRSLGQRGGSESATLTVTQLPPHRHTLAANNGAGDETNPEGSVPANAGVAGDLYSTTANAEMASTMVGSTGGGQPVPIVPPYLVLRYIIALDAG